MIYSKMIFVPDWWMQHVMEFELLYVNVFQRMRDSVVRIRTLVYAELFILTKSVKQPFL